MAIPKAPAPAVPALRALAATFLLASATLSPGPAAAQRAGQNVNMVSGTEWPYGDPFKQRQNEPSIAVSTRNPLHLLAGANDYRTVDIAFADILPNAKVVGDAWLGLFKSFDGGQTWQSTLLPGYPQDFSPVGFASPLRGFSTAADPTVRAANSGLFHYSGIAFDRGTNQGVAFVAQYLDLANKENGRLSQGTDPIRYVRTVVVEGGNSGQFLDKPWIAVDIPRGSGTCAFTVPTEAGPVTQTIPAGNVYVVYSVFVGNDNNTRTKIYLRRSTDCGATWSNATKLTEGLPINQGAVVEVAPTTGHVYVAWRGFSNVNNPNTINIVKSTDGGQTFTKPLTIHSLPDYVANSSAPTFFDQGTTATSFRTNAFPTMAVDAAGRVYVAWPQRGMGPHGDARIVMKVSADGLTWPAGVQVVDSNPVPDDLGYTFTRGHQLMPSLSFTGGKLMVLYYDLRYDQTIGIFKPNDPFGSANGKFYFEVRRKTGEWLLSNGEDLAFAPFVDDAGLTARRHTIDVRVSQADPGLSPLFSAAWVSQYRFGTRGDESSVITPELKQLQVNPPNLPLFKQGTAPFFGDYIEIAGLTMRPDASGTWHFTTEPERAPVHYAVFTSNQDVRPPADGNWQNYTPPTSTGSGGPSLFDPTQQRPPCKSGNEGMRDQNIYFSRITQGLAVAAPQNAKRLTTTFQRDFPVTLQNATTQDRTFRLSIPSQPPGGFASFVPAPVPFNRNAAFTAVTTLDLTVGANAGAARSVYATSTLPTAGITVDVDEITTPGGSVVPNGLSAFVLLNPEGAVNPPLLDPDGKPAGTSIQTVEIYTPNVSNPNVSNPNVSNSNVSNPNVSNPNVSNPNVSNPNVSNPNVSNPDIAIPNVSNPNVSNPNVSNPNVSNPNVSNPNVSNAPVSDATYTMTNNGNTAATYTLKLVKTTNLPADANLQLLVNKTYVVPVAYDCKLVLQTQTTTIVNVPNPVFTAIADLGHSTITDPSVSNPTFVLGPGESALVTLRGGVDVATMTDLVSTVAPVGVSQAPDTNSPTNTPDIAAPLFLTTPSLPDAVVGLLYAGATAAAIGGKSPYTFGVAGLPAGLSINSASGAISGTPTGPAGISSVVLTVTDSTTPTPRTASRALPLRVADPISITTSVLPDAVVGMLYTGATAAAIGGETPYTFGATGLPSGLSINSASGAISGTPIGPVGTASAVITVADTATPTPQTASRTLTVHVADPLVVTPTSLPDGRVGLPYVMIIGATGGFGFRTWTVIGGNLPQGMGLIGPDLNGAGRLVGIPTSGGTYSFLVRVTDSAAPAQTATLWLTLNVITPPPPPDLTVTLTHYPPNPTDLDLITATATVTNSGVGAAGPSWLELCVGGETPGLSGNCRHTLVPALSPGQSYTDHREDTLTAQGYTNHATADYLSQVVESNEGNNTATDTYVVVAATGVTVSGTIYYSSSGLSGVTVELGRDPFGVDPPLRRTSSNGTGSYSFNSVSPATYWVKAYGPTSAFITWIARSNIPVAGGPVTQDIDVPKIITLSQPLNYATGVSLTPTLTWSAITEAVRYVIQINITSPWTIVATPNVGSVTSYTVPNNLLAIGTNYTWQVGAYDGSGHYVGATMMSFSFTTYSP
jgi:hypothetical protein